MLNHPWPDEFDDAIVDELLTGLDGDQAWLGDLAALVAELRAVGTEPPPPVRADLAVLFATGWLPEGTPPVAVPMAEHRPDTRRPARPR